MTPTLKPGRNRNGTFTKDYNQRAERNPAWKGDAVSDDVARQRAQRLLALADCWHCGAKATDRHHIDGNTKNNTLSNLMPLCRRCHMLTDGRLGKFNADKPRLKACIDCGREYYPLRKGQCPRCSTIRYRGAAFHESKGTR